MAVVRILAVTATSVLIAIGFHLSTAHSTTYDVGRGAVAAGGPSGDALVPTGTQARVDWAMGQVGQRDDGVVVPWADGWSGYCDAFAVAAVEAGAGATGPLGKSDVFSDAKDHYEWSLGHGLVSTEGVPPAGALVFYDTGGDTGHVAVSVGGGVVATTQGEPGDGYPVALTSYTSLPGYQGWSWY